MNTRSAAAGILVKVVGEGLHLGLALDRHLPKIPKENDRAFVQALCYGVLRWYWRLERVLGGLTRKPIKAPEIRMLALLGLYQLGYTRVKPHAAVAETVAAASASPWAKPLLNGILRTYQRDRDRLDAEAASDPEGVYAHPAWLIDALARDWPEDYSRLLEQNNVPPPLALRVNRLRGPRQSCLERLRDAGFPAHAAVIADSAVVLDQPAEVGELPGFAEGALSVQDVAAQLAAPLLDLRPGLRVLDLCAAPGGKTLHILETCPELAELVAVDIAPERTEKIRQNLSRAGLKATVLAADATRPDTWWDGRVFDRILLDAPCSATGVIRRHPDIKVLRRAGDIEALTELQRRLLDAVWPLLAPGGCLVYATCSVLRRENECRIGEFLASRADARELPIAAEWGMAVRHGRQILTGTEGMDGFYYARLEKILP